VGRFEGGDHLVARHRKEGVEELLILAVDLWYLDTQLRAACMFKQEGRTLTGTGHLSELNRDGKFVARKQ
jgi:hypothetical protein